MITEALDDIRRRQKYIRMSGDSILGRDAQSKSGEELVLEKQEKYIMAQIKDLNEAMDPKKRMQKANFEAWRILEAIRKNNFKIPYEISSSRITDWLAANEKQYKTVATTSSILKWECSVCGDALHSIKPDKPLRWGETYQMVYCGGCSTKYKASWGNRDNDGNYVEHPSPYAELQ